VFPELKVVLVRGSFRPRRAVAIDRAGPLATNRLRGLAMPGEGERERERGGGMRFEEEQVRDRERERGMV
jgi:hypothetical protein